MATKKKITDDWQQLFPELKRTKLLEMDNRLGPLITGIYLKVVRNTYYTPVAYVHNLCRLYADRKLCVGRENSSKRISGCRKCTVYDYRNGAAAEGTDAGCYHDAEDLQVSDRHDRVCKWRNH